MTGSILAILASTIRLAVPYSLAGLGGTYSERSGVVNIGLEGMMLTGAFTAVAVTNITGSPWFGLLAAIRFCIPSTPLELFRFSQHIGELLPGVDFHIPALVGLVPLQSTFLGMDLGQPPNVDQWWSYALPLLVGGTSFLQQKILSPSSAATTSADDQSQAALMSRQMQVMMPLMFMMFTLNYAVGLSIYFIISNLIRIVQYYIINLVRKNGEQKQAPGKR